MTETDVELQERFAEAYDENGVDLSLVRWCLRQTPAQRLANLESTLNLALSARRVPSANSPVSKPA